METKLMLLARVCSVDAGPPHVVSLRRQTTTPRRPTPHGHPSEQPEGTKEDPGAPTLSSPSTDPSSPALTGHPVPGTSTWATLIIYNHGHHAVRKGKWLTPTSTEMKQPKRIRTLGRPHARVGAKTTLAAHTLTSSHRQQLGRHYQDKAAVTRAPSCLPSACSALCAAGPAAGLGGLGKHRLSGTPPLPLLGTLCWCPRSLKWRQSW